MILNDDFHELILPPDQYFHIASSSRKLDGIAEKVPDHLLETGRIHKNLGNVRFDFRTDGDPLLLTQIAHRLDRSHHHFRWIDF